jgi:hypothetical protein
MTLLYLLDECVAVDEDGSEWVIDDKGAWRRGVERRPPRLLAVKTDDRADAPAPTAEARSGAGSDSTPFGRSGDALDVVQAAR